jgi:ubiquitin-protein ligase
MAASHVRIMRDIKKLMTEGLAQVIKTPDPLIIYIVFTVSEPPTSPYFGQRHILRVKFQYGRDDDVFTFPFSPPLCTFITPIWHCNISIKGIICLNILEQTNWRPQMSLTTIVRSIIQLLEIPNPNSALNSNAAINIESDIHKQKIVTYYETQLPTINDHFKKMIDNFAPSELGTTDFILT